MSYRLPETGDIFTCPLFVNAWKKSKSHPCIWVCHSSDERDEKVQEANASFYCFEIAISVNESRLGEEAWKITSISVLDGFEFIKAEPLFSTEEMEPFKWLTFKLTPTFLRAMVLK